ncbi:unnamed protein product [Didymodactylos carnosus]|uniref:MULE transposase domain-containing protein n=1 Tax=Didymodactylos carnosus TaxID=1234261 RepID=A0A813ZR18_9BILA|nr:unnamed protein product [Didymodactylos carnosus]CAF3684566.1 unnamed protein product [Didymodactylos carnosus]
MLHSALPLPTDLDSLFVPYFKLNIDELFIFMTTRRLLSASSKSTYLQVDGTYKLNWNDFPLLICGTSDSQRHFHPYGIALVNSDEAATCYIELFKTLKWSVPLVTHQAYVVNYAMCDGSKGLTSAQQQEFPAALRPMCWPHVIRRCRAHRTLVPKDKWDELDRDICFIQLCCNEYLFDIASNLLIQKESDKQLHAFKEYFKKEWIDKLKYWFEGAALRHPLTNNGLENWSEKLTVAGFSQNVVISEELETLALKWSQDVIKYATPIPWNIFETVVPTSHPIMSIQEWINCFGSNAFSSFSHFKIWFFCKEYVCKHTVGLAVAFGYHVISKDRMPLGPKKRGGPKKSSLALLF